MVMPPSPAGNEKFIWFLNRKGDVMLLRHAYLLIKSFSIPSKNPRLLAMAALRSVTSAFARSSPVHRLLSFNYTWSLCMNNLTGKTALVTGASRGIGRASALALAQAGAQVLVHYGNSAQAAEAIVAEIRQSGGKAEKLAADLATPNGPHDLARRVRDIILRKPPLRTSMRCSR
jgi:hypothetical protein